MNVFCDAHLHSAQCGELLSETLQEQYAESFIGASCAHGKEEWNKQKALCDSLQGHLLLLFGLHPQAPSLENADLLRDLLRNKELVGIGETGFDFFTDEYKSRRSEQEDAWKLSVELAVQYSVPIVIHNRKALDLMFRDCTVLKRLPSVIFHSFAFTSRDALSLLNHGVNAYFSFSKQILNGNKKSRGCVAELPLDRLLLETDAPFQLLKGESATSPFEIKKVYAEAAAVRSLPLESLCAQLHRNFLSAFCLVKS